MSFWCVTRERAYPFVFRHRLAKAVVPCAQLIYCRDTADVARFAGTIGRHLAARLCPLVVIDAVGPMPGLPGIYTPTHVTTQVSLSRALEFGDEPFWVCGEGVEHIPTLFFRR
jgi:hypothetical protein